MGFPTNDTKLYKIARINVETFCKTSLQRISNKNFQKKTIPHHAEWFFII